MFDIGWSELLVIAVVAVIVVGPKELPRMLRAFGQTVGKLRRMAGDFQAQFNEALREAELDDVRKDIESVRFNNPLKQIKDELSSTANSARLDSQDVQKPPVPPVSVEPPQTSATAANGGAASADPVLPQTASEPGADARATVEHRLHH